ncbi:MAG: Toll-Interleukin receptor domain protein [Chthoniobacteraceae bacterium]|nr:Toll-Interleukin receptor domain protein [Chthoniobacteraceae bacterium]
MNHRAFISYRHCDQSVALQFRTLLESNGVLCWLDAADIHASDQWDEEIVRAITESRVFLLLLTPGSIESPKQQKREVSVADKYSVPIVPVFVIAPERCRAFDYLLGNTQYVDASDPPLLDQLEAAAHVVRRLLNSLELTELKAQSKQISPSVTSSPEQAAPAPAVIGKSSERALNIALLYKRGIALDERLVALLQQQLGARGHTIFVDKQLEVGSEWRRTIREKVENSDAVIPLLSMFSVGSEMLEEEVRIASRHQQINSGSPRILPLRVNYEGALPSNLDHYLQRLHYFIWRTPADDDALVNSMVAALEMPQLQPATVARQMEMPFGAVPLTSPFYVVRDGDRSFQAGIERRDSIVLVKGARQMGKTSLIARGLQLARDRERRVAVTDLQTLNESDFSNLRAFYTALADHLSDQLDLEARIETCWEERKAANVNFERFIRRDVLKAAETPLVWALDEVDRLFPCAFGTEVFGLFRSWHNARALNPSSQWSQFSLVIGYATEASLFIRDVNMSPFNVGTRVALADFKPEEISDLNARYGNALSNEEQIMRLMERVGGQPYLVRRSLYALAVEDVPFEKLLVEAATDYGIFGDHLRRFYTSLHSDPEIESAMSEFIRHGRELTIEQFHRLRSAGLVVGESRQEAIVRCGIYGDYLRRHLA